MPGVLLGDRMANKKNMALTPWSLQANGQEGHSQSNPIIECAITN